MCFLPKQICMMRASPQRLLIAAVLTNVLRVADVTNKGQQQPPGFFAIVIKRTIFVLLNKTVPAARMAYTNVMVLHGKSAVLQIPNTGLMRIKRRFVMGIDF